MQACFVSLCSFRTNVFQIKLDNISFLFKVSEYPQKLKILKATFSWFTVFLFD